MRTPIRVSLMALIAVSGFVGGCVFNEVVVDPIQAKARAAVEQITIEEQAR